MLYEKLFAPFERARWSLGALPWDRHDPLQLTAEQAHTIKMNAITEWASLPATEMFLRDNRGDADFCAFMSIWYYEEMKHALVLIEYLQRFCPELAPTEAELQAVRFEFDPAPAHDTLMLHFCGEMRLTQWYRHAARWHTEPLIKHIYETIAADEARHAGAYFQYLMRAVQDSGNEAKAAFAKVATLMTSAKSAKTLHPTNVHANKALFPNDTVQSRLPDPQWLERWLDQQIKFDAAAEAKVERAVLSKLSNLFETELRSAQDLRRYRKALAARSVAASAGPRKDPVALTVIANSKGTTMNAISDLNTSELLAKRFNQLTLDFDAERGTLWVRMAPQGRPCYTLSFMSEVRECQQMIESTRGRVFKDKNLHNIEYVILASSIDKVFNLGGDLALFRELVEKQDRAGLMAYAKQCVDISFHNYSNYHLPLTTISLVCGEAKGGGFESALSSSVLIAEKSAKFGLPEICFNIFPGMGAYTYLGRKIGMRAAEELILSGKTYTGGELFDLGVVDLLAEDGQGEAAVEEYTKRRASMRNGFRGVLRARQRFNAVTYEELLDTTKIWVDTALAIGERDLKLMERLVRAQERLVAAEVSMEVRHVA
jgi:enoyl-CoA hydratase/carnithine racemase